MKVYCSAKCPRTSGNYCRALKFFKTRYTCNVLVGQGVIDGADTYGDIQHSVSHLCDVMSRGCLSFYPSGSAPTQIGTFGQTTFFCIWMVSRLGICCNKYHVILS